MSALDIYLNEFYSNLYTIDEYIIIIFFIIIINDFYINHW